MATEVWGTPKWTETQISRLERFFNMAQAAMIEQGWRQCAKGQRTTQFCGMVEQAVQEERESCIDIVAIHGGSVEIEAAIRARGKA